MNKVLPFLIFIMSLVYIFIMPKEATFVSVFFKVIPILLILLYAWKRYQRIREHRQIVVGLVVCTIADAAIAFSFLAGLVVFLLGHVFYVYAFLRASTRKKRSWFVILPYILYASMIGWMLMKAIAESGDTLMIGPVIAYMAVISLMGVAAAWTKHFAAIVGSILFILSDTVLAWNLFIEPVPLSHVWIMSTYYSAQFLIATSISVYLSRKLY